MGRGSQPLPKNHTPPGLLCLAHYLPSLETILQWAPMRVGYVMRTGCGCTVHCVGYYPYSVTDVCYKCKEFTPFPSCILYSLSRLPLPKLFISSSNLARYVGAGLPSANLGSIHAGICMIQLRCSRETSTLHTQDSVSWRNVRCFYTRGFPDVIMHRLFYGKFKDTHGGLLPLHSPFYIPSLRSRAS